MHNYNKRLNLGTNPLETKTIVDFLKEKEDEIQRLKKKL